MTEDVKQQVEKQIDDIIKYYNACISDLNIEKNPGLIRSKKGELVEETARRIVKAAWVAYLGQAENRLKQDKKKKAIKIHDTDKYLQRYNNSPIGESIKSKKASIMYKFGTDDHVYIDGKFVLAIECKAFTESAMLKRLIYDRKMLHEFSPATEYILLQFESALGGDFHLCSESVFGSNQYHVFMSREETNIEVITLLEGIRKADRPIHKLGYGKELKKEHLLHAICVVSNKLQKYV